MESANFKLLAIKLVHRQVVAGTTIRLVCSYLSEDTHKVDFLSAIIFLDLEDIPHEVLQKK